MVNLGVPCRGLGFGPTTPAREYHTILEPGAWYLEHGVCYHSGARMVHFGVPCQGLGLGPTTWGLAREYHTILEDGAWYLEHLYWLLRSFYIMSIM